MNRLYIYIHMNEIASLPCLSLRMHIYIYTLYSYYILKSTPFPQEGIFPRDISCSGGEWRLYVFAMVVPGPRSAVGVVVAGYSLSQCYEYIFIHIYVYVYVYLYMHCVYV